MNRIRRLPRIGLRLALVVILSALVLEGSLRLLLFRDVPGVDALARRVRHAGLFAARDTRAFWELRPRLRPRAQRTDPPFPDPVLGWLAPQVAIGSLVHRGRTPLGGRERILFYGDSFTACSGAPERCWEHLVAEWDRGVRFDVLNYGTRGYGLDQIVLSFERSIDLYEGEDPIVVVGVLVGGDLERSRFRFRHWPKPFFELTGMGELTLRTPDGLGVQDWLEAHPVPIRSYLLAYLEQRGGLLSPSPEEGEELRQQRKEHCEALNEALFERLEAELERRSLRALVVIFHAWEHLEDAPELGWHDAWTRSTLERLDLPFVAAIDAIRADQARTRRSRADYFVEKGFGRNHYTALGNEVVFEALREGIERLAAPSGAPDPRSGLGRDR